MFGSQNPSMMNAGMYQQLLSMLQGGGGGGMPQPQNMAPQIAQQQHQPTSNISPVPQMQRPQQGNPQGAAGGAVQAGNNLQQLYGMGQKGYNGVSNMLGGQTPPAGGNPNSLGGSMSPGAVNPPMDPNAAANMSGQMAGPNGGIAGAPQVAQQAPAGMAPQAGGQPFFGGMQGGQAASMYGTPGMAGSMPATQGTMMNFAGSPTASMFGSTGATGAGAGSTFGSMAGGAASGAGAAGTSGAATSADGLASTSGSTMPDWLSSLLDAL